MSDAAQETPARTVRRVLRATGRGSLGTLLRAEAAPYVSLVSVATDHDGAPILLLSTLAEHTRNLEQDPRASLLLDATGELDDPLAGERVTLLGRIERSATPRHRARYLARHPQAALYADFRDFAFHRLAVERAHLIAGFGRIHWLERADTLIAPREALIEREADILAHMNDEHRDAIQLYAHQLLGLAGNGWRATGIDPEGLDLRLDRRTARLSFDHEVSDADAARAALVALAKRARERLSAAS